MGKNLYETPRNRDKWSNAEKQHTSHQKGKMQEDDKKERLQKLKEKIIKQKRKK